MTITLKLLAAGAVVILMEASYAKAGQLLVRGPGALCRRGIGRQQVGYD
jgi:hypothetical protein